MPKSRRRRELSGRRRAESRSGPRKDQPPRPLTSEEKAYARLFAALDADTSESAHLVCLPPLFVDYHATQMGDPLQRCLDDAHLGLRAEVRVAELTITDARDGSTTVHGTLEPRLRGDVFHGHTLVWLVNTGHLVDPTPDRFEPPVALDRRPVVAAVAPAPHTSTEPFEMSMHREHLLLTRALAPPAAIVALLADRLSPPRARRIPHARVAALVRAARDLRTAPPTGTRGSWCPRPPANRSMPAWTNCPWPPTSPPPPDTRSPAARTDPIAESSGRAPYRPGR
ncbi:hypothetical protein EHYA_09590 [Embleya hyalina]|uniref:Uncharacterized protein n=1 Tax=Embleya hyalina TaxID=516124 RepID=A0A401Z4R8_9ACTN|nr:hypothetical protein EHYA_09590 [Embleya hyalina]